MFARVRPYLSTSLIALLIFYFGVNALVGDRGLLTHTRRDEALAARTRTLNALLAERKDLEIRAKLMSDASLSRDLLEERARTLLGFADPRDYVIRIARPAAPADAETPAGG